MKIHHNILNSIFKKLMGLPFAVLYLISDFSFFVLFYLIRYRRDTVHSNLRLVFPEKTNKEIKTIEKQFYRHLCDIFIEMPKSLNMSAEALSERYRLKNPELLEKYKDRSIILLGSHYANWEWYSCFSINTSTPIAAIYTKIQNPYFEDLIKKIRGAYGCQMIQRTESVKVLLRDKNQKKRAIYYFISDQSPMLSKNNYWKSFMGVEVPVFNGYEMIAKRFDYVVMFLDVNKVKRGWYETELKLITDTPKEWPDFKITDTYTDLVEQKIRSKEAYYFWIHKRWKHRGKKPKNYY